MTEFIVFKSKLKILRVVFDQSLSTQSHVNIGARVCYSYLSKVLTIFCFLDKEEYKKIVHASVIAKLDYYVFLYVLHDLLWLPVDMRIMYTTLHYTCKALHELLCEFVKLLKCINQNQDLDH